MASEPRELRGEELVAQWRKMKDDNLPDEELSKWSIHLPPGYHKTLPDDILAWLWRKKLDVMIEGKISNKDRLIVVHAKRIRANKTGYTSVVEYDKMESPVANMRYNISQDYFDMDPKGRYEFPNKNRATEEAVQLAILLNTLARSLSITNLRWTSDCESLKYAMDEDGGSDGALNYVVSVLDYLSYLEYHSDGSPAREGGFLDLLPYYKGQVLEEWQEGIAAPRELEEGVEYLMNHRQCVIRIGELNANLLRKYKKSSHWPYILTKLNDGIAKRAIERQRVRSSRCTLL